jgi:MFS family permease
LGAAPAFIGLIMAASTLTGVAVKLPAGAASDILGRRPLLMAGALVFAALPFTYPGVSTLAVLVALRVVHGSATAVFGPVASATLSDVAPPAHRGAWLSAYSTAQGAGQVIGPILAGYALAAGRVDVAFIASGFIGLCAPLIVATSRGLPSQRHGTAGRWTAFKRGVSEVAGDRLVLAASGAQAAQFVLNGTLNAFLPLYGSEVLGLSAGNLGWLFGCQTLITLAIRPLIGVVSDRAGRRSVIGLGLVVCGMSVIFVSLAGGLQALAASSAIYAAGVATTTAATSAYVTDVTRRSRYGAAHGVFGTIYDVGDALGPIAAGVLVALFGYAVMFRSMALVTLSMAIVFLRATRSDPERRSS